MHKKLGSKLVRDIISVPDSNQSLVDSRPASRDLAKRDKLSVVKGFTLLEVMVVTTILATLATTTLVTLNPTELLAQMRDSQRITIIGMLRDAISLLVADAPTTNLGDTTRVHISLPSNDPNCTDIVGLPALPSGMFYRCVTAANLTRIDGQGWIPLNFNNIVGGSPFTVLPTDITNTPALFYSYIPSPGGRATLTARIESIRQRTLHPTEIFTTHFTAAVDRPPLGAGQVTVPLGSIGAPSYSFVGDLNTGFFSPVADTIGFSTFGVERMRIDNTGFVGIGTTTPGQRLTVAGVIHSTTGGFMFPDGTTQITAGGAGGGGTLPPGTLAGQTLRWITTPNGWVATSNLFNDGTNVGIGTTSPGAQLHIADILTAGGKNLLIGDDAFLTDIDVANTLGIHGNQDATIASMRLGSGGGTISGSAGNIGIATTSPLSRVQIQGHGTTTAGALNVTASDGASRFFVRDDGNVGIGTTDPTTRLDIEGQIRIRGGSPAAGRVLTSDATGLATWTVPAGGLPVGTTSQTLRHDGTNWVANSNIFNTGTNVGIGTITPQARLDIMQSGAFNITTPGTVRYGLHLTPQNATPDTAVGITFGAGDSGAGQTAQAGIYSQFSGAYGTRLHFATTNAYVTGAMTRMTIDSNGNVGIGTATPVVRLHVVGGIRFDGNLNMNGNNIVGVNKLSAATLDPLFRINGVNYATFAPAMVGGVKEEIVDRAILDKVDPIYCFSLTTHCYKTTIDFTEAAEGTDRWVWYQVVDFASENIEIFATPQKFPVPIAYEVGEGKVTFRASANFATDREVPTSINFNFRLIARRFDWREHPTLSPDQETIPVLNLDAIRDNN